MVKVRVLNIRSQPSVSTRREPKNKLKRIILLIMQYMKMETSHNG